MAENIDFRSKFMKKNNEQAELAEITESEAPIALYQLKNNHIKAAAVSKGLCELYGLPAADVKKLLYKDLFTGLHPDDLALVQADFFSFVRQETGSYENFYRSSCQGRRNILSFRPRGRWSSWTKGQAFWFGIRKCRLAACRT